MDNPNAKRVVIGLLGTRLDAGVATDRWASWRPSIAICQHENLLVHRFELLHGPKEEKLAQLVAADIVSVSPETEVRNHRVAGERPLGLRGGLRGAARFRRGLSLRYRYRGIPRPHHHGNPRCTNLSVSADRVAPLARQTTPMLTACPPAQARTDWIVSDHRPGPVEVRSFGDPIRPGPETGHVLPEVGHRHPQRRVQSPDRSHRARGNRQPGAAPVDRSDRRRQVAVGAANLRAQTASAADCRSVRRGQLRHCPRRPGHVGLVRARQGRVHRRHGRSARTITNGRRWHALSRRDRRARRR